MGEKAEIDAYSAWINVHLAPADCQLADVVMELLQGPRLRVLLQSVSGSAPKRLDSLDGLTVNQKVMRVDWFVDALKASKKLPQSFKADSKMISLQSADHLLPLLCHLMNDDISFIYERAPLFLKREHLQRILAEPLQCGPCKITREPMQSKSFYTTSRGKSLAEHLRRRRPADFSASQCVFAVTNKLLKTTADGRRLNIKAESDLLDSRLLCALTNALVPGTFPTEVLVNDRWTINMALETFSEITGVLSHIDSEDLHEGTKESLTALLAYVLMSGLQFSQAAAVIKRLDVLQSKQEVLRGAKESDHNQEGLKIQMDLLQDELCWIRETYDCEKCREWTEHAKTVQTQVKEKVDAMIRSRFCQVTVPRPMTINKLINSLVINLSLTGGNGFYLPDCKEMVWPDRRLVVQDKKTGEYFEDFSGYENQRGTVREMLGLHSYDIVEINPTQHPDHLLFFESTSRNKILKANTKFLYQVFPGTSSQCRRQLLRATRAGEVDTVKKLLSFFKSDPKFVNGRDKETGNTALHIASRHGHMEVMEVLLECGGDVNALNNAGSTPLFLATEGLHRTASLLLLEWGADINIRNRISKTALELTRNADLRLFLTRKFAEYKQLQLAVARGDCLALERHIDRHIDTTDPMASLTSRCIKGSTLLHAAVSTGSLGAVKKLLSQHVRVDIRNAHAATPLHVVWDPVILQLMLDCDGDVNSVDDRGNTPLHCLCSVDHSSLPDCISLLVGHGASVTIENNAVRSPT